MTIIKIARVLKIQLKHLAKIYMILNILVLFGIILIAVAIVAYNSKRQIPPVMNDEQPENSDKN